MEYTIYLDILFAINFGMDIFIIWLTGRFCRKQISWWRYLVSPFVGSLLFVLLIWIPIPVKWIYYICGYGVIGILMCYLAFQPKGIRDIIQSYGCQLLVSFLLGGIMNWLYFSTPIGTWLVHWCGGNGLQIRELVILLILSGVIFIVLTTGFRQYQKEQKQAMYRLSLYFDDIPVYGIGLLDTGNFLVEPISRRPVVVASADWMMPILPEDYQKLLVTYLKQERIDYDLIAEKHLTKARWIPYQTVGRTQGELLGIQCRKLVMRYRDTCMTKEHVIVGISRTPIAKNNRYQVLLHVDIVEQEE